MKKSKIFRKLNKFKYQIKVITNYKIACILFQHQIQQRHKS